MGQACAKDEIVKTSKKDTVNHGFGMENIRLTVERYKGSMRYNITKGEGEKKVFTLEIMMMI